MKISHFIFIGFLLILLMFAFTTFINFRLTEQVGENSEFLARSTTIIRHSNRFQRNIINMGSGLRGYLFSGEQYFIQAYDSATVENDVILSELSALIPKGSDQRNLLEDVHVLNNRWINEFAAPLIQAKRRATSPNSISFFNALYKQKVVAGIDKQLSNQLQNRLREFSNYEYNLRDIRKDKLEESLANTRNISFYLTTFSILTGFLIAVFLAYRISARIVTMVNLADNIASGQYNTSIEESGSDELSRLARSLNHMAKVLDENISLLKRKNLELDQFAHIVSHDMKAPLRGIDNVVTWIEEDHGSELSPKVQEYIDIIKGRLQRAENLIRGILSYSMVGKDELGIEEVDTKILVQEVVDNTAMRPGMRITIASDLPTFMTEKIPLTQIFTNLINNAIKHHDKKKGEIKVYSEDRGTHYEFFIEDNGPGIAKNYHDKIFVIFQTLQERDSFESTGVGLAIVRKILDDRKQTINITSTPGEGSIFSFTWPKQ